MKLSTISVPGTLAHQPAGVDIDVASNVAPAVMRNMAALETLIKLLPNSEDLCAKLAELKELVSSKLPASRVIEVQEPAATILDYDATKPIGQQRAHIHGVGSAAMSYLPSKVIRETGFVDDIIKEISDMEQKSTDQADLVSKYKELSKWSDQMMRSTTTLKNGIEELAVKKQLGNIFPTGTKITEEPISAQDEIDSMISSLHVMEMYNTMKIGLGEKAWVAISKRLRSQGHDHTLVEKIINQAILRTS